MERQIEGGRAAVETGDWAEALQSLRHLLALDESCLDVLFDRYLDVACATFGLRVGVVGKIEGEDLQFQRILADSPVPFAAGDSRPLSALFAADALRAGASLLCHDVGEDPILSRHPLYLEGRFETYAGAPIRVGSRIFGILSLLDPAPRATPFPEEARAFLDLLADTLGHAVARREIEAARQLAEEKSREAAALFTTAFANAPIGMALVGLDGTFLKVNTAVCRFLGYSEADLLGRTFQSLTFPDDLAGDLSLMQGLLTGEAKDFQMEKRYVRSDGMIVWGQLNAALVCFEDGRPHCFVSQIQDINPRRALMAELDVRRRELEEANRKLLQQAAIDPLTGTLNRRALRQRLDEEMAHAVKAGAPLAFVMVDVDHFKDYNDRHGHLQGDIALKKVATCLRGAARETDTIGRFGGEEFMLLLPETGDDTARLIAERLRERIATSAELRWPLTVSVGVHVFHPEGKIVPVDRLIALADLALYRAKQLGRNRVEMA
ncbi:sensor domain-containing diguanylate cyclase [Aquabacter spiritensis]|uniref:diguanylate cyclase n=1 Tax=Aquabacter spiritensis TaxID=933073 RepID=A0A4R3M679_9HYPH|nr:sensor domain-containing diguanylate cyclase [Aquabacter spiritensis]TCT08103.1 PAS domain S-box-containing protein/diguanylate cyclase (GGDEF)-like protein [Aquabacter spiritensis]